MCTDEFFVIFLCFAIKYWEHFHLFFVFDAGKRRITTQTDYAAHHLSQNLQRASKGFIQYVLSSFPSPQFVPIGVWSTIAPPRLYLRDHYHSPLHLLVISKNNSSFCLFNASFISIIWGKCVFFLSRTRFTEKAFCFFPGRLVCGFMQFLFLLHLMSSLPYLATDVFSVFSVQCLPLSAPLLLASSPMPFLSLPSLPPPMFSRLMPSEVAGPGRRSCKFTQQHTSLTGERRAPKIAQTAIGERGPKW